MAITHPDPAVNDQCKALTPAIAAGDMQAFDRFYALTSGNVYGYCLRMTGDTAPATDLLMRTYTTLWDQRHQLPDMAYPRAYVLRVASRLVYHHLREKNGLSRSGEALASDVPDEGHGLSPESRDILEQIDLASEQLSPEQRKIFRLSKFEGKSNVEIAEYLDIPVSEVAISIEASMKSIRAFILGVSS